MHKLLLATVAAAAIASPALARDGSPYVGIEGGVIWVQDTDANYQGFDGSLDTDFTIDHKLGLDTDIIAGYDFGPVRAEAELGYKTVKIKDIDFDANPALEDELINDNGGKGRTLSLMGNLLADFGNEDGFSAYVGGGAGVARTKLRVDPLSFQATDSNFAWQLIAGVRTAITPNLDAGLKYRYFQTKYNVEESDSEEVIGKWKSHSLLASLIYNFGGAAAAPPPPPPPPTGERG
jgi:opacity protein-like surface antigen